MARYFAYGSIDLYFPHAQSLKGKRKTFKSILQKIKAKLNISLAETDFQDLWQRGQMSFALAGSDIAILEEEIALLRRIIESYDEAEIADFTVDYI